ncbi:hypothetical protein [Gordonia sp. UBA7599]|uniref:hypothetical protein n=1 Tax=unclassified Gordonia (in: high G+C Gram-positive bacteria) TaxID=2657482 RepID=UPI0025C15BA9|nr:hypothetical protein [Gordonia sp. UBA7599]HNP58284.1 hypothetical protein [Gordonia sp. (in: high G+C Gram-positive bacteria)]
MNDPNDSTADEQANADDWDPADIPALVCSPPRSEWFKEPIKGPNGEDIYPDCGPPRSEFLR